MNLLTDPWIDVFTVDGPATVSVADAVRDRGDILDVTSGDALEDAAILRMLLAIDLVSDGDPARWLNGTARRWELFGSSDPFWQNSQLREHLSERSVSPVVTLPYRFAGNGSTLLDHHHNESGTRLTPAAAARALLMRQQFSVGGIQPFPESVFGVKSAKSAIASPRPFAWVDAGNLADTLVANRRPGPAGTFHHSWPGGRPADTPPPGGQADALTWQSRSILLVPDPDGYVGGVSITEGLRYGESTDPHLVPHTTFTKKKPADPYTAWDVHLSRPPWRQLLTAYASADAPGVFAAELPSNGRIRLAGLAAYQSRIDGPVTGTLPVPLISRACAAELDAAITETRKRLIGRIIAAGRILAPSSGPTSTNAWWKRSMPTTTRLNTDFEPIVRAALTAQTTIADAIAHMRACADTSITEFASTIAAASPTAAAAAMTPTTSIADGDTSQ